MMHVRVGLAVLVVTGIITAPDARACVACGSGDPTTVAFDRSELDGPSVRIALELRTRAEAIGQAGRDQVQLDELRGELGLVWFVDPVVSLELACPLLVRDIVYADAAHDVVVASGDVALRAQITLDAGWSIMAGVSLPTAPVLSRAGRRLPLEAQAGTGSVDPSLGLAWSDTFDRLTPRLSAWATVPLGPANASLRLVASLAVGLYDDGDVSIGVRAALEGRHDGRAFEDGAETPDSGGLIVFAGGDVLVGIGQDLALVVGLRAPVVNDLRGHHDEALFGALGVSYDAW